MNDDNHAQVIADEVAIENAYNTALVERAKLQQRLTNQMTANTWTTRTDIHAPRVGELIGRVALEGPNPIIEGARDFYIGTAKHDGDDYQVFSWAAPVACTFYRKSTRHHALCDDVIGVRVLAHRGGKLVDFQDEAIVERADRDLFPRRTLQVPRAPIARRVTPIKSHPQSSDVGGEPATSDIVASTAPSRQRQSELPGTQLRAPDLLRRQLAAPKTIAMSAVLATLQADQYEAITRSVSDSQILQGHPGTGKTIIAAHRAAYLLNAEAPPEARPRGRVLMIGPTEEYVEHVRGALRELIDDAAQYEVTSISALLEDLAGLPRSTVPTASVLLEDVSLELARLIDMAFARAKTNLGDERPNAADVYAELVWLLHDPPSEGLDSEWVQYLRELPDTYDKLKRRRIGSFRGLMAYIGVRTIQRGSLGHVIVDEAQDIHPIEWEILGRLGNSGGWTILGDLNQRRTDHTFGSWDDVARLLAIERDDGTAPVQLLERGYRSTAQIIKFANQLLPARDRGLFSLQQDGEMPKVQRVATARSLSDVSFNAAIELMERVGTGTVAVITVDPASLRPILVRRGWRADIGDPYTWRSGQRMLKLLPPDRARGLEFDGVVVVEPADFPENVGRQGVLYTALTRPNRLLTVVHHRALPRGVKARP